MDTKHEQQHDIVSKHELSLAEFPLCMLAKSGYDKTQPYIYEDVITVGGKLVKRVWKIKPDAELGHATPSTYATLYDLLQIWQESGFKQQYIHFGSLHELCRRRKVTPGKNIYRQLKDDIKRLVGITYDVENAFWDNTKKQYISKTFHIFDEATYYGDGAIWGEGYVKVSDILYQNILSNSLLYLEFDSEFFHSLTPLQQRLVIYLSKIFKFQRIHKRELIEFAKQLPILIAEQKKIKYTLRKASETLIEKGFTLLGEIKFDRVPGKEYIIFVKNTQVKTQQAIVETDILAIETALLSILAMKINDSSFKAWIRPVKLLTLNHENTVIGVPDETFVYYLKEYYTPLITDALHEVLGHEVSVAFEVKNDEKGNVCASEI